MKKLVILVILLIGIMITVSACGVTQKSSQKPMVKSPTSQTPSTKTPSHTTQISGASIFSSNCASCHGVNGVGTKKGPALNTGKWNTGDEQKLAQVIMNGKQGMPAFKNSLSDHQITSVTQYLIRLKK